MSETVCVSQSDLFQVCVAPPTPMEKQLREAVVGCRRCDGNVPLDHDNPFVALVVAFRGNISLL